ncbi:hemagglutinin repeat-containing protein, partial [Ursidibacter sp. B-7004-1]
GDVNITAQSANITAARSDYESHYKRTMEQKGVTIAVNIPAVQAIQAVSSALHSAKSVGNSKNNRINALGAVNAGFEAMRAVEQVGSLAQALSNNPTQAMSQDVSVSITYGEQKHIETQHQRGNTAEKSAINAGGKVNITTEGAGKDADITIAGADVSGKAGTHLNAAGEVNILAVDENHLEQSKNKSQGFNAGVAISYGSSGFAFGVTAGGNIAKGYGNGESQAWVGSQVGSLNSQTTIKSGTDTHIIGSQVKGKSVKVNAENLNIQSLQDTMKYEGKQESASAQVTVGYGASGSVSYSKSKMKADMASVNQQAGIFAGDEGYDADVRKHTELTGGLVTSTAKAEIEGKNRFSTGTISHTDIENHAEHKGSAISVSGSAAANFDTPLGQYGQAQSSKTVTDEKGNTQLATGKASLQLGANIGIGSDKDSQRSQTLSGINTSNLTIRDEKAQLEKTGKTATEARAEIKTDTTLETAEAHSGKLESRFDKDKLQKELAYQVKVTREFQTITKPGIDSFVANQAENKRKEADELEKQGKYQQAAEIRQEAKNWETGGKYRQVVDAITNAVGLALGGKPTEGVIAGVASPYINEQIKKATENHPELNIPAHMIWGAIEAELNGGKAINGAVAAGIGEAGAYYLTKALYNKDNPETLTEEQKKSIADLSKVAGGVAAGLSSATTGGNSLAIASSVGDGMGIAENAVGNNFLSEASRQRFNELIIKRSSGKELTEKEKFEILELAYFDQRSDVLARKYQRGEKLTPLEKLDLDRFVERFINETVSGRTDFGRGEKYTSGADVAVANLILGEKYLNNIGYKPNYSYPYVLGHTGEWRNKSDWKTDETIYREVFNELNNRPNLPQTWQELVQEMQNAVVAKGRSGVPNATNFSIRVPNKITAKDRQVTVTAPTNYEKQTANLKISTGAENVALYPKLKEDLAKQQQRVVKDLNIKPQGSVLMTPDYRQQLSQAKSSLSPKLQKEGNTAIAKINIEGVDIKMMAGHSRINSPQGDFIGKGNTEFDSLRLPNKKGDLIDRKTDSEYKIFSNLADQLGSNTQAKGQVTIFTERPACQSCLGVAEQFNKRYPNIKVHIFDNNGQPVKVNGDK